MGTQSPDELVELAITKGFYMDNFASGTADKASSHKLIQELIEELNTHGLEIRKWAGSDNSIPLALPQEVLENSETKIIDEHYSIKRIGDQWNPNQNVCTLHVNFYEI